MGGGGGGGGGVDKIYLTPVAPRGDDIFQG